ncbi:RNA 2',3'-cyclic phosphodiesterase [Spiractinospora alimapuensis]|uniref:RNA 2',3'-cyclic phosphodiesterase n=1 Tax=Spiractinospora alimapuensis TaxID=2820884 RepID=UPI001F41A7F0|nr:RNA 2',3'-cyclic phosphodiesterase [Spiractinospora alimapuensis]QVQ50661.1 RNA 2',3'-cyclic phosphodiesterase [Spiractinospora alimapuensis]
MRLFLAIDPPESALEEAERVVAPVRRRLPALRWSAADTHHLTLAFLGQVAEARLPAVERAVERSLPDATPARLRLAGAGTFPQGRTHARVLWLGIGGDLAPLHDVQARLTEHLVDAGLPLQPRRYVPHLTLARCPRPTNLDDARDELAGFVGEPWHASQVVLYHSTPRTTPRYHGVARWDLP